jgi:hypothetical protein
MVAHGFTARQLAALVREGLGHRDERARARGQDIDGGHAPADHGSGTAGAFGLSDGPRVARHVGRSRLLTAPRPGHSHIHAAGRPFPAFCDAGFVGELRVGLPAGPFGARLLARRLAAEPPGPLRRIENDFRSLLALGSYCQEICDGCEHDYARKHVCKMGQPFV